MSKKIRIIKPEDIRNDEPLDEDPINEPINDDPDDGPIDEEQEPEIDPDDTETDDEYYNSKAKTSSCIRNNYCNKCDGSPHEPEGLCHCPCHDIA